jgi:hypothetical protein
VFTVQEFMGGTDEDLVDFLVHGFSFRCDLETLAFAHLKQQAPSVSVIAPNKNPKAA